MHLTYGKFIWTSIESREPEQHPYHARHITNEPKHVQVSDRLETTTLSCTHLSTLTVNVEPCEPVVTKEAL